MVWAVVPTVTTVTCLPYGNLLLCKSRWNYCTLLCSIYLCEFVCIVLRSGCLILLKVSTVLGTLFHVGFCVLEKELVFDTLAVQGFLVSEVSHFLERNNGFLCRHIISCIVLICKVLASYRTLKKTSISYPLFDILLCLVFII